LRYNVCQSSQLSDLTTLPGVAYGIQVLPDGRVLVADSSAVILLSSSGGQLATFSYPGISNGLFGLALDPDGIHFWVTNCIDAAVYEGDLNVATLTKVIQTTAPPGDGTTGFCGAGGVVVVPGGTGMSAQSRTPIAFPVPPATDQPPTSVFEEAD
jgi:streptogramin lyase